MSSLEEIKARKMAELQAEHAAAGAQQQHASHEAAMQQQIAQLEMVVKQHMTREALERYGNIKAGHPEMALQVLGVLGQLIQGGRVQTINDTQFKELLKKITPKKREIKISRV